MNIKHIAAVVVGCLCIPVIAQLGMDRSTTYNYYSEEKDNPAWKKDIITADGPGLTNLRDRQGVLASKQATIAIEIAASNLQAVASSYNEGFLRGIENLQGATNGIPNHGLTMGLVMPLSPSETRTAIEGFIVEQDYDEASNTDILTIHFTQSLAVQPKIVCPYIMDGGFITNRIAGSFRDTNFVGSNWTNVYTVSKGDEIYENCHKLYVKRPVSLIGYTAWFNNNVRFGTDEGIDYGNIVHTAFGEPLFSGTLTNHVDQTYVVIKDGAILEPGFVPCTP